MQKKIKGTVIKDSFKINFTYVLLGEREIIIEVKEGWSPLELYAITSYYLKKKWDITRVFSLYEDSNLIFERKLIQSSIIKNWTPEEFFKISNQTDNFAFYSPPNPFSKFIGIEIWYDFPITEQFIKEGEIFRLLREISKLKKKI